MQRLKKENQSKLELSYIIPVYFNQNNFDSLINLLKQYSKFDKGVLEKIEFVIIDDGSTIELTIPENIVLNYQLIRIIDDIHWNIGGARNLGVVYAHSSKIIITDSDHFFPENIIVDILKSKTPSNTLYKFKRTQFGKRINSHTNTFYTSKQVFFSSLGYDEEFSGHYGLEDIYFVGLQKKVGNNIRYFTRLKTIESISELTINNHSLIRDSTYNQKIYDEKLKILKSRKYFLSHSRLFLNFDFNVVAQNWI